MLVLTARTEAVPAAIERGARYAIPCRFAALAQPMPSRRIVFARSAIAPTAALVVATIAVRRTRLATRRHRRWIAHLVGRDGTDWF